MKNFSAYFSNIVYLSILALAGYVLFSQYKLEKSTMADNNLASNMTSQANEQELRSVINNALSLEEELELKPIASVKKPMPPQALTQQLNSEAVASNVTNSIADLTSSTLNSRANSAQQAAANALVANANQQSVSEVKMASAPIKAVTVNKQGSFSRNVAAERDVLTQLASWRSAWQDQDVARYLGSYSRKFEHTFTSFDEWSKRRRLRITKPKWVRIDINRPIVKFEAQGKLARVVFEQKYRASNYSDVSKKELLMEKEGANWNIVSEKSL